MSPLNVVERKPRFDPKTYYNNEWQLPQHIDSTMIAAFKSCPRKYFNEFVLGLRPELPSIHLHAGGCFASALEAYYKAFYLQQASLAQAAQIGEMELIDKWGNFIPPEKQTKTLDRMIAAYHEYITKWDARTDHIQPYFIGDMESQPTIEFSFSIPLTDSDFPQHPNTREPFVYVGRFDKLGRFGSKPIILDDKTTGSFAHNWAQSWSLRSQFMGYVWACRHSGLAVDSVCVRGVCIQKTQIKLQEVIQHFPDHLIHRWYHELKRTLWGIVNAAEVEKKNHLAGYPHDFADACGSYGGCWFRLACEQIKPYDWMGDAVVSHWNPLEKNPDSRIPALHKPKDIPA